jgi:hypothetical protein
MLNAINTKLLLAIVLALSGIAGGIAYQNRLASQEAARRAALAAEHERFVQQVKHYQATQNLNWGNSAHTLQNYRPK